MLSDLLDKITSYNLFNYLLPGAVFAYFVDSRLGIELVPDDLVTAAFVYYFLGIVVSRFGSLVVEPSLKKLRIVEFEPYSAFLSAAEKDSKIDTLVESANMYRTFLSAILLLLFLGGYTWLEAAFPSLGEFRNLVAAFALGVVFLFAYLKQLKLTCSLKSPRL